MIGSSKTNTTTPARKRADRRFNFTNNHSLGIRPFIATHTSRLNGDPIINFTSDIVLALPTKHWQLYRKIKHMLSLNILYILTHYPLAP